jgi:hypothetical protein
MKQAKRDVLAGRSPEMQLLRAVRRFVESKGGKIVVIGGIEVQQFPGDPEGKFRLAVGFLGRKPTPDETTPQFGERVSPSEDSR